MINYSLRIGAIFLICFACLDAKAKSSELSGPFASKLTQADVTQIKAAVSKERSVSRNIKKIEAVRPDKVVIQSVARTAVDQDTSYEFSVYKRGGVWAIDANSIQMSIEQRDLRTHGPSVIR